MKNFTALLIFLVASGVATADSPPPKTNAPTNPKIAASTPAVTNVSGSPSVSRVATDVVAVTVTGNRPRSVGSAPGGFVDFRSTAPRTLSTPLAFDLVTEPVLLTVRTGNTEELRRNRIAFPFESVQDHTVRNSDVLKIRLAKFKLD